MALVYGADSRIPANTRLTNGYYLYEWVMRKSCFPSFWGRNITGKGALEKKEIDFLKAQKCKIVPIFNGYDEVEIASNRGGDAAKRAAEAAKALGISRGKGIVLFAEIPSTWSVNHNWMISFARTLINCGYRPGFIGNTDSSEDFNFGRQCSHYVLATRKENQLNSVYWSVRPQYKFDPEVWATYAPSQLLPKDMHIWQYGTVDFHSIIVGKCYARDETITQCFWGE